MESLMDPNNFKPVSEALAKMPTIGYAEELPEGTKFDGYYKDKQLGKVAVFQTPEGPVKRQMKRKLVAGNI